MSGSSDALNKLRTDFYLGSFQDVINNSDLPNLSSDEVIERDTLVYRSHIGLGNYDLVQKELDRNLDDAPPLFAVLLLSTYLHSTSQGRDMKPAYLELKEYFKDPFLAPSDCPMHRLVAGSVFLLAGDHSEALKYTMAGGNLELLALNVQIFMDMKRLDSAQKQLKKMQEMDEDHLLTRFANGYLNLALGGPKVHEAYMIFGDLSEKHPRTPIILNGKAVCCMRMDKFDEAETILLEALNKDAKDCDTLANLIMCTVHAGKSPSRYISQLKEMHPDHILVKNASSEEVTIGRAKQKFGAYLFKIVK